MIIKQQLSISWLFLSWLSGCQKIINLTLKMLECDSAHTG